LSGRCDGDGFCFVSAQFSRAAVPFLCMYYIYYKEERKGCVGNEDCLAYACVGQAWFKAENGYELWGP
jgi:hypothetical protein